MNNLSDKDKNDYFELLNTIPVKNKHLAQNTALLRLKREKRKKKMLWNTVIVASVLFLSLIGMVRYSSTVANALAQIPGMKPLIEMITFDKGIEDILENDYIEVINQSQTIDGHTLTITDIIADEYGMLISYKIESNEDLSRVRGVRAKLKQGDAEIEALVGGNWLFLENKTYTAEEIIHVAAYNSIDYSIRDFELSLSFIEHSDVTFTIPFTLKNEMKPSKRVVVDEQLEVDGQKFTVHELILSPIRAEMKMSIDPSNTMKILHFGDISIIDENGENWGKIRNGIVGFGSIQDEQFSLMLESNYFRTPKSLTIQFNQIEAIDKKDQYIEMDWETKQVLTNPDYLNIDIEVRDHYEIVYTIPHYQKVASLGVFGKMIDANGNVYNPNSVWHTPTEENKQTGQTFEVNHPPVNPVKLQITRYENYLQGSDSVTILLK